ncbi:cytochrome c oxidase subunit II [sulfur-oxidizing endosymbiont of Gigantopelta aegis]|uniref:cytochrome c oxidase subunit II n=1 Tax=sulfur-oxidizing endosymbiont of Gigantopelta aegis TaxID=2794934 RepID=UPI001FE9DD43|nr:c-type cytochrome [sulfur-oxidizing endosymbiont of Gigantopelta aegis]
MLVDFIKKVISSIAVSASLLWTGTALAEYKYNFPEPVTPIGQDIYDVHMLTMGIITVLLIIITSIVLYAVFTFRKDKGYEPDQEFHNSWFGRWSWVIVPIAVLMVDLSIAGKAQPILEMLWESPTKECSDPTLKEENKDKCYDMIVKITGHQWWWEYEYPDLGIKIESRYTPQELAGDNYLRAVDNNFVLPINTKIRFLQTSVDVNHAFWIPELAFKKDAIAGYISETWGEIIKEGIFRGQCAELCGTWHARMPAVVEAVSKEKFALWVAEQQAVKAAKLAEASSGKVWTKDELYAKGETIYNVKCAACHQATGLGIPPAFPALKGSKIATGPVADHLNIVLHGKNTMPAWAAESDLDLAAIITYERNAWGNNTNDVVQPADIKAAREKK